MQKAIEEYVTAEKQATREYTEGLDAQPIKPPLVLNVAGEEYYIDEDEYYDEGKAQSLPEPTVIHLGYEAEQEMPPQTLGVHNPIYGTSLMLIGNVTDLDNAELGKMLGELAHAFILVDK
jgi:hypothetical protein